MTDLVGTNCVVGGSSVVVVGGISSENKGEINDENQRAGRKRSWLVVKKEIECSRVET